MILAATRARGYGTRDASFVGGYYGGPPIADGLLAIAVPLRDGPRVLGALNMLWMRPAHTVEAYVMPIGDLYANSSSVPLRPNVARFSRPWICRF